MTLPGDPELAHAYDEAASLLAATEADSRRYRTLFECAPTALFVTDDALKIVEANRATTDLLASELRYVLGKPLPVFVDPADRRRFRSWALMRRRGAGDSSMNVRMQRRNGVSFEAGVHAVPSHGEICWSVHERTDDAQAEERLWELNRELEHRVGVLATELEATLAHLPIGVAIARDDGSFGWTNPEAQSLLAAVPTAGLRIAERLRARKTTFEERVGAEAQTVWITAAPIAPGTAVVLLEDVSKRARVEQSNAEFVQNAAHQLRTPIAGIASSVAALEAGAGDDPEKRDRFLGHIRRESDRMARLVDALLTLAGLQRGVGLPLSELVPLRPLLEEVAEAESVGRIDVSCAAEIAVVGDRDLLGQAIGNVIANAVQHGGEARAVHVRARLDDAIVHLDVTDEGPGVSAESGDRVFERFYRATSERRGSGLGLAIAAAAAEATNGTLELLPSTGTGATFRFTLPGASLVGGGLR